MVNPLRLRGIDGKMRTKPTSTVAHLHIISYMEPVLSCDFRYNYFECFQLCVFTDVKFWVHLKLNQNIPPIQKKKNSKTKKRLNIADWKAIFSFSAAENFDVCGIYIFEKTQKGDIDSSINLTSFSLHALDFMKTIQFQRYSVQISRLDFNGMPRARFNSNNSECECITMSSQNSSKNGYNRTIRNNRSEKKNVWLLCMCLDKIDALHF